MAGTSDCIFCKIVSGTFAANVVLDVDDAVAFLDIAPLADGHTLLIPKQHYETISEMPTGEAARFLGVLPKLAAAVQEATGAAGFNVLQANGSVAGQVVNHVHFHIIPRDSDDGLGFRWNSKSYNQGAAEVLRDRIKGALSR